MGEGKPAKSADNSERITTGDTISDSGSTNDVAEQAASALRDEVNNPAGSELVTNEGSDTDAEVLDAGSDASLSLSKMCARNVKENAR